MNNRNSPCFCGSGKKFKNCCMGVSATAEEFLNREFRSEIYAQELEKDLKYSKKVGKEVGLFKRLMGK